jgi:hypothetical protein
MAMSQPLIRKDGRSGLLTRIAATEGPQRDVPTKKAAPAWSNEPGHNRGDDLPADDTQLPSVGL